MATLAAFSALVASFFVARSSSASSHFTLDLPMDDLHFTNEEIERDLFEQFERLGA